MRLATTLDTSRTFDADDRLHSLIAEFEMARDAGKEPDPADWIARHPELADYFAAQAPLRPFAASAAADCEKLPEIRDYQIESQIGRGGMGTVYKARQLSANRIVALKVISPGRLDGLTPDARRKLVERFITEAQAAARLEHENIVSVYEVGENAGLPFYSMRYVEGPNLNDLLEAGPLAPKRAAAYIEQVARAVHEAHRHGILHRDLKPHNILIDAKNDAPLVADFGLAKLLHGEPGALAPGGMTMTGDVMGTPPYMPPEQAVSSAHATVASDVYSLGATLYALLTGRPPFEGPTPVAILKKVLEEEPAPVRKLVPAVPRDLEVICHKCLEKAQAQRYGSAGDLAGRLRLFLEGKPIPDRAVSQIERVRRWCGRNPILALTGSVAALAMLTVALVSVVFAVHATRSANKIRSEGHRKDIAFEQALDHLCRSKFQEARALLASPQVGRRWVALDLLRDAEKLRIRQRRVEGDGATDELGELGKAGQNPSRIELRNLAVTALMTPDMHSVRQWNDMQPVSPDNRWALRVSENDKTADFVFVDLIGKDATIHMPRHEDFEGLNDKMSMCPNGKWFAISTKTGLFIGHVATGKYERLPDLPRPGVPADPRYPRYGHIAPSPDGRFVTAGENVAERASRVLIWDLDNRGPPMVALSKAEEVDKLKFSPGGRWLTSTWTKWANNFGTGQGVTILDREVGFKPEVQPITFPSSSLVFSSNDKLVALGAGMGSEIWDLNTRVKLMTLLEGPYPITFTPDGSRLLVYMTGNLTHTRPISCFRVRDGYEEWRIPIEERLGEHKPYANGAGLLTMDRMQSYVLQEPAWDCPLSTIPKGPTSETGWVAFSPNGEYAIVVAREEQESFQLINLIRGENRRVPYQIQAPLAFSPNGEWLVLSGLKNKKSVIALIHCSDAVIREIPRLESEARFLFSHDSSKFALMGSKLVVVRDVATGAELSRLAGKQSGYSDSTQLAFSADGQLHISDGYDLWNVATGKKVWEPLQKSLDGRGVRLLQPGENAAQKPRLYRLSPDSRYVATIPRGSFLGGVSHDDVHIYDLRENRELALKAGEQPVPGLSEGEFSSDGRWAFTAGNFLKPYAWRVDVWSIPSGQWQFATDGNLDIKHWAYSSAQQLLAVGCEDGTIHLWDLENRVELFRLRANTSEPRFQFTAGGKALVFTDSDSPTIQILDLVKLRSQLAEIGLEW